MPVPRGKSAIRSPLPAGAICPARTAWLETFEVMLMQLAVKVAPAHAQPLSGQRAVSLGRLQGVNDEFPLGFLDGQVAVCQQPLRILLARSPGYGVAQRSRQVARSDFLAPAQDYGMLDG